MVNIDLRKEAPLLRRKIARNMMWWIILYLVCIIFITVFAPLFLSLNSYITFVEYKTLLKNFLIKQSFFIVLFFILFEIIGFTHSLLYWQRYCYGISIYGLYIKKGAIVQKEITIPFSQLTDVYITQEIDDLLFKIYDVHVSTPTEQSGCFSHIDGVSKKGSEKLKMIILSRIKEASNHAIHPTGTAG